MKNIPILFMVFILFAEIFLLNSLPLTLYLPILSSTFFVSIELLYIIEMKKSDVFVANIFLPFLFIPHALHLGMYRTVGTLMIFGMLFIGTFVLEISE